LKGLAHLSFVMANNILSIRPLGFPWQPPDPFLATMHHVDNYPAGDDHMAPPRTSLRGRNIGADFDGKDGWNMYHGDVVPGFPSHPHRGFETVTIVRRGLIDHADSLGAAARFGRGDVQWITAGKGIQHSEMFPLVEKDKPNPTELFQIWLNLAKADKMADPHFTMLWADKIPHVESNGALITVIAGTFGKAVPPSPPPRSWAARADNDVAIWTIRLQPNAKVTLPAAQETSNRALYFFAGSALEVEGDRVSAFRELRVRPDAELTLTNVGNDVAELLLLQGRPINEPVAQYGPFVMNTRAEVQQAFFDYERTRFGGWPWPAPDPVHPREKPRWARFVDGHEEVAGR
jgi:quercetin 2,3-dioxygenase